MSKSKDLLSDLAQSSEKEIRKFSDNPGLPAREHEKKLAQEKSKRVAKAKTTKSLYETFYTVKAGKVLLVTIKPNGAYSTYLGSYVKKKEQFDEPIRKWSQEGKFVPEWESESFFAQKVEEARMRADKEK